MIEKMIIELKLAMKKKFKRNILFRFIFLSFRD